MHIRLRVHILVLCARHDRTGVARWRGTALTAGWPLPHFQAIVSGLSVGLAQVGLTPDQVLEARTALAGFPSRGWVIPSVQSASAQQTV
jgi:hypothetical protein